MKCTGQLLIASPYLGDGNFNKSVVLIIHHDDDGAFGVVLNRPAPTTLRDVWEEIGKTPPDSDLHVNVGGPIEGPLMAIHTRQDLSESQIIPGIHLATHRDHLDEIVRLADSAFRVFSGYSGWGPQQLEGELDEGAWLIAPARADHVFAGQHEDLWKEVADEVGRDVLSEMLNHPLPPVDPSVN